MITMYRVIRYEFKSKKALQEQLDDSLAEGMYDVDGRGIITIKDRKDDPCVREFFQECCELHNEMVTRKQLKERTDKQNAEEE